MRNNSAKAAPGSVVVSLNKAKAAAFA